MSNYTAYLTHTTGAALYAKARPQTTPWATGVIDGDPGNGGEYSFTLDSDTEYAVYIRATATALITDSFLGSFGKVGPTATALATVDDFLDTEVAALTTNLAALITTVGVAGAGLTGVSVTFTPATGTLVARGAGTNLSCRTTELHPFVLDVVDSSGTAVDFTGLSLEMVFESGATDVTIATGDITKSNGSFGFTTTTALTTAERLWKWALRKTTSEIVMVEGTLEVTYAPNN